PASEGTTDETIAPTSETPPAPAPAPATPPALPTPPKVPETPPVTIVEKPGLAPVAQALPFLVVPVPSKQVVGLTDLHAVECTNCSGDGGATNEFRCPSNYVVTGFRYGADEFDVTPESGFALGSIGSTTTVVGGLRIVCSRLDQDHVHADDVTLASYATSTAEDPSLKEITYSGKDYEFDSAVNCPLEDGMATGIFGRSGARLDSFGLTCGLFLNNEKFTGVFPAAKETLTSGDSVYGGTPGIGGAPFEASCDTNEVVVGMSIASGDQVDGIKGITCAKVAMVDAK
ncbi:MAG TPA: hypothetical protein VLJ37_08050, partial [bacterium]|nr:hypothetical protein [bacterium]